MANLFAKAVKSATPKTTKAKDEKVRIKIEDSNFFDKIEKHKKIEVIICFYCSIFFNFYS